MFAGCRTSSQELDALNPHRLVTGLDVGAEEKDIGIVAKSLAGVHLDVLINNAGILSVEGLTEDAGWDIEAIRRQFEVNSLGPLKITRAFLPNLGRGSKVVIISSLMGSIDDNGRGGFYGAFVHVARTKAHTHRHMNSHAHI